MAEPRDQWAAWLREQFDAHPTIRRNADLSRAGGMKDNGRPRIDNATVTQWLRGRRPSYELALAAADAFGASREDALNAAGYPVASSSDPESERPARARTLHAHLSVVAAIESDPDLVDEARAHLLNQYDILRRFSSGAVGSKTTRPERAVARKRPKRGPEQ